MRVRGAAAAVGVVFGFTLAWTGLSDPDLIRRGLLFESPYLWELFFGGVVVAFVGNQLLRRAHARALLSGERIAWDTARPQRNHIVGGALFGLGWAVADSCPGPIASQLAQGVAWSLLTITGVVIGIRLHARREEAAAGEPEKRPAPRASAAAAA
ncbi:MAG: DUF6691 family protein [Thermoleophilaceae bacterium]